MGVVSPSVLTLLVICSYPGWAHSFSEFSGDVDQAWTPEGIAKTYLKYYNHGRNFSEVYDGANTQAPSPQCKKDLEVYTAALLSPGNHTWALLSKYSVFCMINYLILMFRINYHTFLFLAIVCFLPLGSIA